MAYTQQEILDLMEQNKELGAAALLETYTGLLWSVCARHLSNSEDIRECVNDVFSEFCQNYKRYNDEKGSLKNYLCLIADRRAMNRQRDNRRREQAESSALREKADREEAQEQSAFYGLGEDPTREELDEAIDALEPQDSQIIRMKYYQGLSYQDIAKKLDLNYETVKKRGQRSLKKLWRILVIGLIMLLLAACAVIAHRYFQFAEGVGFSWYEDVPIYRMTEASGSCRADGFTFHMDNAAYRDGYLYLSIGYKADREPEDQEDWSRQNAVYQVYMNNMEVKDCEFGPGGESRYSFDTVQFVCEWQPEAQLPESFQLEISLAALENEDLSSEENRYAYFADEDGEVVRRVLELTGPDPEFTVTLSRVGIQEDVSAIGVLQSFEDTGFVVCPGIRNEEGTRFSLYLLNEGMETGTYQLSPYLLDRNDRRLVTLTGKDGRAVEPLRIDCGMWGLDETVLQFPAMESGKYTLAIPYLMLESSQTSNAVYLPLPKEEGEIAACDQTLLFPDGTGIHLMGIRMEHYAEGDEIIDDYEGGAVTTQVLYPTFRYEMMFETVSLEKLKYGQAFFETRYIYGDLPEMEAGEFFELGLEEQNRLQDPMVSMGANYYGDVVFLNIEEAEAPDWLELRLREPSHMYDQSFEVKVTVE